VYEAKDLDVIPPTIVDQRMPAWIPPSPVFAYRMYRGTLEVVVGEDGAVESRAMSEPAFPSADRELPRRRATVEFTRLQSRTATQVIGKSLPSHLVDEE
jgi:hypothetical protein